MMEQEAQTFQDKHTVLMCRINTIFAYVRELAAQCKSLQEDIEKMKKDRE